jgi:hypothetical protein
VKLAYCDWLSIAVVELRSDFNNEPFREKINEVSLSAIKADVRQKTKLNSINNI